MMRQLFFICLLVVVVVNSSTTTTSTSASHASPLATTEATTKSAAIVSTAVVNHDAALIFTTATTASPEVSSSRRRQMMKMTIKTSSSSSPSVALISSDDNENDETSSTITTFTTMSEFMVRFRKSLERRRRRWRRQSNARRNSVASDAAIAADDSDGVLVPVEIMLPRGGALQDEHSDDGNNDDDNENNDHVEQSDIDNSGSNNDSDPTTTAAALEEEEDEEESKASVRGSSSIFDLWGSSTSSSSSSSSTLSASALVERWTREKLQFLDRIALVASSMLKREQDAHLETVAAKKKKRHHGRRRRRRHRLGQMLRRSSSSSQSTTDYDSEEEDEDEDDDDLNAITLQSDLTLPGRHFYVVTTAALPWFTGTAVNPLLRAAHLHRRTLQINQNHQNDKNNNNLHNDENFGNCSTTTTILFTNTSSDDFQSWEEEHANNGTTVNNLQQEQQHHPPPLHRWVTLVIPWLELPKDQQVLYGQVFASQQDQEDYIRHWLRNDAEMPDAACPDTGLQILFYPARYHSSLRSIFAMGDIMNLMTDPLKMDVAILEEPEHCNWFRAPGDGWTKRFHYVIGIVHTNYKEYASSQYSGLWTAPAIQMISAAMVRAYCHKVIKLSDALQTYAPEKECTSNVHGVRDEFLQQGLSLQQQQKQDETANATLASSSSSQPTGTTADSNKAYFIGKLLWAKGLDLMLDMEDYYRQCTGKYFAIDIYGNGPDEEDIKRAFHGRQYVNSTVKLTTGNNNKGSSSSSSNNDAIAPSSGTTDLLEGLPFLALPENLEAMAKQQLAKLPRTFSELRRQPIPATFPGRVDHAQLKQYKIFVNPSISEVLCTTTAEALAMGKFVIIPVHPSNTFFLKFPNCLAYRSKFEFVANLRWALTHEPEPLTMALAREFTWEAATDRLVQHAAITRKEALERERLGMSKLDQRIAWFHNELGKGMTGDMLRKIFGAGPASEQVQYQLEAAAAASKQDQADDSTSASATSEADAEDEGDIDDETKEDQDDGLSRKFRRSSFAEAMRTALGDISSFVIQ